MLNDFQNLFVLTITPGEVVVNISVAFICGLLISFLYRWTYKGPSYSISYVNSLIVLSMITSIVIMVIGNNLARAFGLVGAMSIIRFRTAIKDTQDIVFIFFSLVLGMAAGVGLYQIAFIGVILIGIVLVALSKVGFAYPKRRELLVQISYRKVGEKETPYIPLLEKYCRKYNLINVKSIGEEDYMEISYYIYLKDKSKSEEFVRELKGLESINFVNLLFDEEKF
ncbi:MAG: hypothetical protein DRP89_03550 [Candidatus Neomarinimicrobiota bacterium]|nr:MAG: hypothetical protein DRP89_03550 [Candidatus Neomarinimicrobiota bacterium]